MSTPASRYGPHDPTTAPTHVVEVPATRNGRTVYLRKAARIGQYPNADVVSVLSPALVRQREQINRIARGEPLTGLRSELCATCSRPEHECLSMPRGLDDDHAYEPPRRRGR